MSKRPKLVPGRSYRFTFTPTPERIAYQVRALGYSEATVSAPYSTVVTIGETGQHAPRAVTMWANRWIAHNKNTVEIIDVTEEVSA